MFWYIALFFGGVYLLKRYLRTLTIADYGRRYVLVTGCDTGFGLITAQKLDRLGINVFAACFTERGADELRNNSSNRLKTVDLDVSNSDSIQNALKCVKKALPEGTGLWGLVNNAGIFGTIGLTEVLPMSAYQQVLNVNILGLIEVTKAFLPLIRKAEGRIVNTASVFGRVSPSICSPYNITKYAVEAFSDSLRRELYKTGVTVHIIEPGIFKTYLSNTDVLLKGAAKAWDVADPAVKAYYGEITMTTINEGSRELEGRLGNPATFMVPDAYVHALTSSFPKYRYLVGSDANTFFRFLWSVPEWMSDFILCFKSARPPGRGK